MLLEELVGELVEEFEELDGELDDESDDEDSCLRSNITIFCFQNILFADNCYVSFL